MTRRWSLRRGERYEGASAILLSSDSTSLAIGGDVGWNPTTRCAMVNEGLRLWGHNFIYDQCELTLLLRQAGFTRIEAATWRESRHEPLRGLEARPFHKELICEAQP